MLKQVFTPYGEVVHVKIPVGKRCGFVQYANRFTEFVLLFFYSVCLFLPGYVQTKILLLVSRSSAEEALVILQGTLIGGQNVRLSWGRSPSNKQAQVGSCILTCLFHTLSIKTDVFIFPASTGFQPVGWG